MGDRIAIIIGAGPAGLTAAYELLDRTDINPIIFEMSGEIGGISRTVNYKGNRIDIGPHRFFSKSNRVMKWWQNILPLQGTLSKDDRIIRRIIPLPNTSLVRHLGEPEPIEIESADPEIQNKVMLVHNRVTRIFFLKKFFDYPVSLSKNTILGLGLVRTAKIGFSYIKVKLFPIKNEKSLEDFFINRFGKELYLTFFKDYTEKVWGMPCNKISSEWGVQRIKGLSITKTITHAIRNIFKKDTSIGQKSVETSLIKQFTYPKYGAGQMWEEVAKLIEENGGEVHLRQKIVDIKHTASKITEIQIENRETGIRKTIKGDYYFSTMPVKDLISCMRDSVPENARDIAEGLMYRDLVAVGLLLDKLKIENKSMVKSINNIIPDHWIYVQEKDVKLCRIQIFNNWSPCLVTDKNKVWIGLEYFCNIGDELWNKTDKEFLAFAKDELEKINIIEKSDVVDGVVIRTPKAYPAYFGSYANIGIAKNFLNKINNLFLVGRNGMHRYNNQDHSMLSSMIAVDNIVNGIKSKENIWKVNAEREYHEEN